MNQTPVYSCVIEWDIEATNPIEAAHEMVSAILNSPGPIVKVYVAPGRSADIDLTCPEDTADTDGITAKESRRHAHEKSAVMTPDGCWSHHDTDTARAGLDDAPTR